MFNIKFICNHLVFNKVEKLIKMFFKEI